MEVATGAGACGRRRRHNKPITITPIKMTTTPPTTMPTIELVIDEEVGEDEEAWVPVGD